MRDHNTTHLAVRLDHALAMARVDFEAGERAQFDPAENERLESGVITQIASKSLTSWLTRACRSNGRS